MAGAERMTTREEAIAMMDWLRHAGAIGIECETGDGNPHYPETCATEYREYLDELEMLLRNDVTHHVYYAIRQAAKLRWRQAYGEELDGPVMAHRCKHPFPSVQIEAVRIPGREVEAIAGAAVKEVPAGDEPEDGAPPSPCRMTAGFSGRTSCGRS